MVKCIWPKYLIPWELWCHSLRSLCRIFRLLGLRCRHRHFGKVVFVTVINVVLVFSHVDVIMLSHYCGHAHICHIFFLPSMTGLSWNLWDVGNLVIRGEELGFPSNSRIGGLARGSGVQQGTEARSVLPPFNRKFREPSLGKVPFCRNP